MSPQPTGFCQFEDENGTMCRAPLPPGDYLVCADCYDYMRAINPHPEAIDVTPPEPARPGRWVPAVLFAIVVVITLTSWTMTFWCLILMPALMFGFLFGMGPGREVQHQGVDMHPNVGTDWHPNQG